MERGGWGALANVRGGGTTHTVRQVSTRRGREARGGRRAAGGARREARACWAPSVMASASSRMMTLCLPGGSVTFFCAKALMRLRTTSMPRSSEAFSSSTPSWLGEGLGSGGGMARVSAKARLSGGGAGLESIAQQGTREREHAGGLAGARRARKDEVGHVALLCQHLQAANRLLVAHDILDLPRTVLLQPLAGRAHESAWARSGGRVANGAGGAPAAHERPRSSAPSRRRPCLPRRRPTREPGGGG